MCRIYGHLSPQSVTPHVMRRVAALQWHGGPDSQEMALEHQWGIGNNRLAIIDLDGGRQPYRLGEEIQAVFNGEIYNYKQLRRRLAARGYTFDDDCDGSIIPAMYREYGLDFPRHLDGMFAIALVDLRQGPTLVIATDPLGIKSLYYHWDPVTEQLSFASEIPALLGYGGITPELWLPGVDAYLTTKAIFGEQTMFAGIRVMPPSSIMVARIGAAPRLSQYETALEAEAPPALPAAAGEVLHDLLDAEVQALLMADVPLSTVNSGGLDSSLVTALASRRIHGIHSFNVSYEGDWPFDEKVYAREVAQRCGTKHHEVVLSPQRFADLLPTVVWHLGQPNADPITLSSYALFQAVREAGFKVTLSGDGADEMFGGYERLAAALNTPGDWVTPYVEALSAIPQAMRAELYSDEYSTYVHDRGPVADQIRAELSMAEGNRLQVLLEFERAQRLPAYHLRRVDHLSMAHSVEVRVPFCQPRIRSFARQVGAPLCISEGKVKRVLYQAANGRLPDSVLHRKKQPFTLPIAAMMQKGQPLYRFVADVLDRSVIHQRGLFNPDAVEALLRRQAQGGDNSTALTLWSLMILELWMHEFGVAHRVGQSIATAGGRVLC